MVGRGELGERKAKMKREGDMLESVLWRAHEIQARVAELGHAISEDFDGRPLVILGVTTLCLFLSTCFEAAEEGFFLMQLLKIINMMLLLVEAPCISEVFFSASDLVI